MKTSSCAFLLGFLLLNTIAIRTRAAPLLTPAEDLPTITAGLTRAPDANHRRVLVSAGINLLTREACPSLTDELAFLDAAVAALTQVPAGKGDIDGLFKALKTKHKADARCLARIAVREASVYTNWLNDQDKARVVLDDGLKLQQELAAYDAVGEVELLLLSGENYLSQADTVGRGKALTVFNKVLEFPIFEERYKARFPDLKRLYTKAALRVVELTGKKHLHEVHVHPFARATIGKVYPTRLPLISAEAPDAAEFRVQVLLWLQLAINDQPGDSEVRKHLEAVSRFVKKEGP